MFAPDGEGYKSFDMPNANYASSNFDSVLDADGNVVGLSMFTGYSANEKRALSLGDRRPGRSRSARSCAVVWGEPDGGHAEDDGQPHEQKEVRVVVSPVPYSEVARTSYAEGWRTEQPVS